MGYCPKGVQGSDGADKYGKVECASLAVVLDQCIDYPYKICEHK